MEYTIDFGLQDINLFSYAALDWLQTDLDEDEDLEFFDLMDEYVQGAEIDDLKHFLRYQQKTTNRHSSLKSN